MLKESFKVYCAINDGIINLIDKVDLVCVFAIIFIMSLYNLSFLPTQLFHLFGCSSLKCQNTKPSVPLKYTSVLVNRFDVVGLFCLPGLLQLYSQSLSCLTRDNVFFQARSLSEFYEACKGLELARNFQFPVLREVPDEDKLNWKWLLVSVTYYNGFFLLSPAPTIFSEYNGGVY